MDDLPLFIGYIEWVIVIGLTLGFFSYYSKKFKKFGSLFPMVLISVWVIIAIIKGAEYMYFDNSSKLFSLNGFAFLLGETLPMLIFIGGITFGIKYIKFRKK